ncbi:MAG: hypothetical protein ACK4UN_01675 [Limisphaerales bacterium]
MMTVNPIKILVFLALLTGFAWFTQVFQGENTTIGGWSIQGPGTRSIRAAEMRATAIFVIGAGMAIWGDKRVGTLDPIALRGLFIIFGVLLMIFGLLLGWALRNPG